MNDFYFKFLSYQEGLCPSIEFSTCSNQYYVSLNAEFRDDCSWIGVCSNHENAVDKAMDSFNKTISGKRIYYNYNYEKRFIDIPNIIEQKES